MLKLPRLTSKPCTAFGSELLNQFSSSSYAYLEQDLIDLADVKKCARKVMESYNVNNDNSSSNNNAISSLRGFYQFQAASGRNDDIRCFSIGNPKKSVGDLRGDFLSSRRCYSSSRSGEEKQREEDEILQEIFSKRNQFDDPAVKVTLEKYYDVCCDITQLIATSIETSLKEELRKIDQEEDDEGEEESNRFATSTACDWEKWLSRRDSHLEVKLYAAQEKMSLPPSQQQGANIQQQKKSKILRRTKHSNNNNQQDESISQNVQKEDPTATTTATTTTPTTARKMRMDVHADLSVCTLLLQDAQGGLEVFDRSKNEFVSVPVSSNAILVHAGNFLERYTDGKIISTPHRVRTVEGAPERCSVVFFGFPNFDANITNLFDPNDSFIAGDLHPRYY